MSKQNELDTEKSVANSIADESPSLAELSQKDKPWDKHRANTDKVERFYQDSEFEKLSDRIHFCSDFLDFRLVSSDKGDLRLKLYSARFCRVRHCPVCQWRRSLMWKAKAYKIIPEIEKQFPNYRWLFLTLTVKNCPIIELRQTLNWMHQGFKRLVKLKDWPALGWLKSVEVTRGKKGDVHPHLHCLLLVQPSYFTHGYLSQSRWSQLWQRSLRIDYQPVMDVQAVKKGHSPMSLVPELLKYCTKESDLVADREWFLELNRQMYKMRAIATGGILKDYLRELENEPEDFIGHDDENIELDEGHLFFGWKRNLKKYKLIDH